MNDASQKTWLQACLYGNAEPDGWFLETYIYSTVDPVQGFHSALGIFIWEMNAVLDHKISPPQLIDWYRRQPWADILEEYSFEMWDDEYMETYRVEFSLTEASTRLANLITWWGCFPKEKGE